MSIKRNRKKQIRIGLIGSYPPPYGGVSIHIRSLERYLESKHYQCVIYNTGKTKNIEGVINIKSLLHLIICLLRSREDCLHAHGGADLYKKSIILYIMQILFGKRWMLTIHSGGIIRNLQNKSKVFKKIISVFFNKSEKIICVNDRIKNALVDISVNKEKCIVIPAFSFNESISSDSLPEDIRNFIEDHEPVLSCAGYSFAPHYGYDIALKALGCLKQRYPGAGLIIMGGNKDESDYSDLINQFKPDGIADVFCSGDIDHGSVLSIIRKSTIYLRPSLHDGDSISVREALAMRVPVIASDAEKRPDGTVLFRSGDSVDLEKKILSVIENMDEHKKKTHNMSDNRNLEAVFQIYDRLNKT